MTGVVSLVTPVRTAVVEVIEVQTAEVIVTQVVEISGPTAYQVIEVGVQGPSGASGADGELQSTVTKTSAYTVTASDELILADAGSAAFDVTLPAVAGAAQKVYRVKKIDGSANPVTIRAASGETIDGASTTTLADQFDAKSLASDGATWWIFSFYGIAETVAGSLGQWDFSDLVQSGHLLTAGL